MNKQIVRQLKRARRRGRVRSKVSGAAECPRFSVFRSNRGMYLQLIDDASGKTLANAITKEIKAQKLNKTEMAAALGKLLAEKAIAKKIGKVVFDKGSYKFHGRVKAAAEGARAAGLKF